MITLTRLDKNQLSINPDLIKTAEAIPDTIITLTTGERMYVRESVEEVRARFLAYQHTIREQRARGVLAPDAGEAPPAETPVAAVESAGGALVPGVS
jgi:flagellar protein FlbD